jgi:hypothetical protein
MLEKDLILPENLVERKILIPRQLDVTKTALLNVNSDSGNNSGYATWKLVLSFCPEARMKL